jgi:hypothetical protein
MPRFAMGSMNGRALMRVRANAQCMAPPVRGAGAALRTYVRAFRGVHQPYLHL